MIVAQIALAFVLLAGCGLLGLSFIRVMAGDPGFRQDNVLTGMITLPWVRYQDAEQRVTFVARLLAELRALPGVIAVGTSTRVPFAGIDGDDFTPIEIEGRSLAPGEAPEEQYYRGVTAEYFAAMGVPLRAGRFLTADDAKASDKRCVIDEALAQRYWPAGDALGHRVTWGGGHPKKEDFSTIVGIVGAVKQNSLADRNGYGVVYYPSAVFSQLAFTVAVRTAQAPEAVATAARATVLRLDPELPLTDVQTMEDRIDDSLTGRRLPLLVAGTFAGIALLLAAVGIYGVLAYSVAQRRREIGVRMALGAQPEQILRQFLGLSVRLLGVGLPLGLIGAFLVGRTMTILLFGIGPANPVVLGGAAAILAAVAILACLLPARRASPRLADGGAARRLTPPRPAGRPRAGTFAADVVGSPSAWIRFQALTPVPVRLFRADPARHQIRDTPVSSNWPPECVTGITPRQTSSGRNAPNGPPQAPPSGNRYRTARVVQDFVPARISIPRANAWSASRRSVHASCPGYPGGCSSSGRNGSACAMRSHARCSAVSHRNQAAAVPVVASGRDRRIRR